MCVVNGGQWCKVIRTADGKGRVHAESPRVTVEMEGLEVVGLCDTGAEVSLISTDIYDNYLRPKGIVLQPSNVRIRLVGGMLIPCKGSVTVGITVCGVRLTNVVLLVCDRVGESNSCLLGMNILSEIAEIWPVMYELSRTGVNDTQWKEYIGEVRSICKLKLEEDLRPA